MSRSARVVLIGIVVASLLLPGLVWAAGEKEQGGGEARPEIAVVTPYMANATTAKVIQHFESEAGKRDWKVSVSDTAGDFGLLVSRIQDAVTRKVDGIVLGMGDPAQMTAGLSAAQEAGIPVFGLDAGMTDGVYLNVTSDNTDLGRKAAQALLEATGEEARIVMFTHDPHPGVRARAEGARAFFGEQSGVEIVREVHIEVPGPVEFARKTTEDLLTSFSEKGSIDGIWGGWDEPAFGAVQAIRNAGRGEIRVVGVDGTDFAKKAIDEGDIFAASVEQDFQAMAAKLAELMESYMNGEKPESRTYRIPGSLYR